VSAEPVVIVDHDARWFEAFDVAAAELRDALRRWVVEIEHIGSTAVVGLAAKPIIDIQVGVVSLDVSPQIVAAVEALGYVYVPDFERELPNRRYFRRTSPIGVTTHHVHTWSERITSVGTDTFGSETGCAHTPTTGIVTQRSSVRWRPSIATTETATPRRSRRSSPASSSARTTRLDRRAGEHPAGEDSTRRTPDADADLEQPPPGFRTHDHCGVAPDGD
jgi:hypothetical protein